MLNFSNFARYDVTYKIACYIALKRYSVSLLFLQPIDTRIFEFSLLRKKKRNFLLFVVVMNGQSVNSSSESEDNIGNTNHS
jgi:hypothetical protein